MLMAQHIRLSLFCLSLVLLNCAAQLPASAQQPAASTLISSEALASLGAPPRMPSSPANIIKGFIAAENKFRQELNQYAFKRDVVLQTIGANGEVTGEYIRNSQFVFDDQGARIEKVLYHPKPTIKEMKITREDIQDLASAQLFGLEITESGSYEISFAGSENLAGLETLVLEVRPARTPDPHKMHERFFSGRLWIDPATFQIKKIRGIALPAGKQRFPVFETSREESIGALFFPTQTFADDFLRFPERVVHYRIRVRYYDFKRFASRVRIIELDDPNDTTHN
jgi:hypothetical protein